MDCGYKGLSLLPIRLSEGTADDDLSQIVAFDTPYVWCLRVCHSLSGKEGL